MTWLFLVLWLLPAPHLSALEFPDQAACEAIRERLLEDIRANGWQAHVEPACHVLKREAV